MKQLFKSPFTQWLIGALIAVYIFILRCTCRVKVENAHYPNKFWEKGKPILISLWHGRLLMMSLLPPKDKTMFVLISGHSDGRIIKNALSFFGLKSIRGSSSKGGALAARKMVDQAKAGNTLLITPDGPHGPRMHADKGVIGVARMSELPILPVTISAKNGKIVSSWDRFLLPRPFTTLLIRWGKPITVQRKADEATRLDIKTTLEKHMNQLQKEADRSLGRTGAIEPDNGEKK